MSHLCLLGVATLTLTSAGFAGSDTNADLQARLTAAETRISELSATSNNNWLNDARADEIRGLVNDVLADADNRSNLQGGGAGYNGGFTVGSADGNWSMNINGLVQTAWTNEEDEGTADTNQWGFSDGRTWLNFSGTIAGDYSYDVRHGLDGSDDDYANGSWDMGNGWNMTMGSFRRNDSRESMIGDGHQMGTDRAGGDPAVVQGARWSNTGDDMRTSFSLSNGGANGAANASAYNYNVRVEYLAEGSWGQFDEFTCADGSASGTLVGVSYRSGDEGDSTDAAAADVTWNVDLQMQMGGSSLYVSYGDYDNDDDDVIAGSSDDGNTTQVMWSTWLDSDWELYIRYYDEDGDDGETTSIGVNQYWAGHNAKWTTQYDMNDTEALGDVTTVTSQIQLMF